MNNQINIIKERYEKYRKRRIYFRLISFYILGLIFILSILSMNFLFMRTRLVRIESEIEDLKNKMMKEKNLIEKIKKQNIESKELLRKIMDYQGEKKERITWTSKLAEIGQSVPYGIWIDKLTGQVKYSRKNKKEKLIVIEGYVLPQVVNERKTIDMFIKNLERFPSFKNTFLSTIREDKKNNVKVIYFELKSIINTGNGNT